MPCIIHSFHACNIQSQHSFASRAFIELNNSSTLILSHPLQLFHNNGLNSQRKKSRFAHIQDKIFWNLSTKFQAIRMETFSVIYTQIFEIFVTIFPASTLDTSRPLQVFHDRSINFHQTESKFQHIKDDIF